MVAVTINPLACQVHLCLYMEPMPDDVYISPLLLCCQARIKVIFFILPFPIYCENLRLVIEVMLEKEKERKKEKKSRCFCAPRHKEKTVQTN